MPIQLKPYPTWGYDETKERIEAISKGNVRAFARVGYLLGGRLSELFEITPERVGVEDDFVSVIMRTRKVSGTAFREVINIRTDENNYVNQLLHFKKKKYDNFQEYIGYKRTAIEKHLNNELGTVPHGLRHLRATHMGKQQIPSKIHQSTAPYLKYYFGWTKLETASYYIDNLTVEDIKSHYFKQT